MSIIHCEKHDRKWDSDRLDECPLCENEPTTEGAASGAGHMTTDASNATDYSGNSLAESLGDGTPSTNIRKLLDSVQSESCMVLYNDTLHGREVHCDNLWVITTHQLTQIRSAFDALAELDPLDVYEKTIEIEKHWKQRVTEAEAKLAAERDKALEFRNLVDGAVKILWLAVPETREPVSESSHNPITAWVAKATRALKPTGKV